jgi:ribosomal protein S18 acetylase RimI-like enzyme
VSAGVGQLETVVRPLTPADLVDVVAIDAESSGGRARPGAFARRLTDGTATSAPTSAIAGAATGAATRSDLALGAVRGDRLVGFTLVRTQDGEFGDAAPVGVLDSVGVRPGERGAGVGRSLMAEVIGRLRAAGVAQLRTQAWWTEHDLLRFFASAGFALAPKVVLDRDVQRGFDDDLEVDLSLVHTLAAQDLPGIVRVDHRVTGRDRTTYYRRLVDDALHRTGVRLSLVARVDGAVAGFLMARLDYGDFGLPEPTAVLDTVGIDPAFARNQLGRTLLEQLLLNLRSLGVDVLRTEVELGSSGLLTFLTKTGFTGSQRLSFALALAKGSAG